MNTQLHRRCRCVFAVTCVILLGCVYSALAEEPSSPIEPSTEASAQLWLVIGSPGSPEFGERFNAWADAWRRIAQEAKVELSEIGTSDSNEPSDSEQIRAAIERQAATKDITKPLWIVFIGHGTFKAGTAKFNLRGPDVSADQLNEWLEPIQRPIVFVNVTAASGPFVNALSRNGRVIVTATQSGEEQNFAHFGAYLPQALADKHADLDHDDEVSLLEAVLKASTDTSHFYASDDRIQTEHAMVDDNGDQRGTPADRLKTRFRGPSDEATAQKGVATDVSLDGDAAAKMILLPSQNAAPLTPEEVAIREKVEAEILTLRRRKASLSEQEYYVELEKKLLELSRIYAAAENRAKMPASSP